jgi:hypothetical protein
MQGSCCDDDMGSLVSVRLEEDTEMQASGIIIKKSICFS